MTAYELAHKISQIALDKKAIDVKIVDIRGLSSACDFFVIATGSVDQHVKAISEHVRRELSKVKIKPLGYEGQSNMRWILLDYVDVIVHIFDPGTRDLYQLEKLWLEAKIENIDDAPVASV